MDYACYSASRWDSSSSNMAPFMGEDKISVDIPETPVWKMSGTRKIVYIGDQTVRKLKDKVSSSRIRLV